MALLTLCNLPLVWGGIASELVFLPDRVLAGEWWRILTHPFVHVSWYHLLLDGAAFICLYGSLPGGRTWRRPLLLAGSGLGALAASLSLAPEVYTIGLCGLSGIGHGLMAVVGLDLAWSEREQTLRWVGLVCCLSVLAKSGYEVATGGVLFAGLHSGAVGLPVPACHLGGTLGAMSTWALTRRGEASEAIA